MPSLAEQFGPIDIYLFDQLLRERLASGATVLDAGCGGGRNLVYLLRSGFEVFAVDVNPEAIAAVRSMAAALAPRLPAGNFRVEQVEAMSLPDASVDLVISSAVLHFARDHEHFAAMLREMNRVLRPGGLLFCRLATTIGMEHLPLGGGRFLSPDGVERYLPDEAALMRWTHDLNGELLDLLKTTVVQGQRSMTTWVMQKRA